MADVREKWLEHENRQKLTNDVALDIYKGKISYSEATDGLTADDVEIVNIGLFFYSDDDEGGLDRSNSSFEKATDSDFQAFKDGAFFKKITGTSLDQKWRQHLGFDSSKIQEISNLGKSVASGETPYEDAISGMPFNEIQALNMSLFYQVELGADKTKWTNATVEDFQEYQKKKDENQDCENDETKDNTSDSSKIKMTVAAKTEKTEETTVKPLQRDAGVLEAQAYVKALGYEPGKIDGVFGNNTQTGLYQYANDAFGTDFAIADYGKMDAKTLTDAVIKSMSERMASDPAFRDKIMDNAIAMLESGDREQIKAGQTVLNDMGLKDGNNNALSVDGVVGPKTQFALDTLKTLRSDGSDLAIRDVFQTAVGDDIRVKEQVLATNLVAHDVTLSAEFNAIAMNTGAENKLDQIKDNDLGESKDATADNRSNSNIDYDAIDKAFENNTVSPTADVTGPKI
ncbi:MAG: peptidoglycan-binding protein [Alphaproteobacteria bacterium]|nr:peptidoglycan-binding protein [Alphaproteobacteria bacterium]